MFTPAQVAQDAGNAISVGLTSKPETFWDAIRGATLPGAPQAPPSAGTPQAPQAPATSSEGTAKATAHKK